MSCLNPALNVPLTVRVYGFDIKNDPMKAAKDSISTLEKMKKEIHGDNTPLVGGVVKLGFSWMGCDVKAFKTVEKLSSNLHEMMFENANNRSQIATSLIVQEFVPNRIAELR